jgi:hypothetical protein
MKLKKTLTKTEKIMATLKGFDQGQETSDA